jgi:hypothetical protein
VALFPKELERDPSGALADRARIVHDVPWDEPAVVAAYVEHLARLHPTRAGDLRRRFGLLAPETAGRSAARADEPLSPAAPLSTR